MDDGGENISLLFLSLWVVYLISSHPISSILILSFLNFLSRHDIELTDRRREGEGDNNNNNHRGGTIRIDIQLMGVCHMSISLTCLDTFIHGGICHARVKLWLIVPHILLLRCRCELTERQREATGSFSLIKNETMTWRQKSKHDICDMESSSFEKVTPSSLASPLYRRLLNGLYDWSTTTTRCYRKVWADSSTQSHKKKLRIVSHFNPLN